MHDLDGLLDVIVAQRMPRPALVLALLAQVMGANRLQRFAGKARARHVLYYQTRNLTVINRQQAPLHIDGDPAITAGTVSFRINPASVSLIFP